LSIDSLIVEYFLYFVLGIFSGSIVPEFFSETVWATLAQFLQIVGKTCIIYGALYGIAAIN